MEIKQLAITNFGKFNNVTFNLNEQLNIFFGLNEAGKSTLVAFMQQVLFGFVKAGDAKNYEINKTIEYGGEITFINEGDEYIVSRFQVPGKKSGELIVQKNGQTILPEEFFALIKNINGDFYRQNFVFDDDTLREIQRVNGESLTQQINVLGASNSAELSQLARDFDKESENLYKGGATAKKEINQDLKNLDSLIAKSELKKADFDEYTKNQTQLAELSNKLQQDQEILTLKREKLNQLNQQVANIDNFRNYQTLQSKNQQKIIFNKEDFDQAQTFKNQRDILVQQIKQQEENLENIAHNPVDNSEAINQLINDWQKIRKLKETSDDLKLQSDNKNQLAAQTATLQPEVEYLATLNPTELKSMQQDFDSLSKEPTKTAKDNNLGIYSAGVAILLGILAFVIKQGVLGIVTIIIGILALIIGIIAKGKNKQNYQQELAAVRNKRDQFTEKYHFAPPSELKSTINAVLNFQNQTHEIDQINQRIASLETTIKDYRQKFNQLFNQNITDQNFLDIEKTINYQKQQQLEFNNQQNQIQSIQQNIKNEQDQINVLNNNINQLFAKNKVNNWNEYETLKQDFERQKRDFAQMKTLANFLGDDLNKMIDNQIDISELENNAQAQQAEYDQFNQFVNQEIKEQAELNSRQKSLVSDDEYFALNQEIADQKTLILDKIDQFLVLKLNSQWLIEMMNLASHNRFPKMQKLAQEYFAMLTNDRYNQIDFSGKNLAVKKSDSTKKVEVKHLSRGTAEQLYFALKLSFVALIEDEINLPIIIDDAFVNFDFGRTQNIQKLLLRLSEKHQVIILTARQELHDMFDEKEVILLGEN